jgi:hypothetical protein
MDQQTIDETLADWRAYLALWLPTLSGDLGDEPTIQELRD